MLNRLCFMLALCAFFFYADGSYNSRLVNFNAKRYKRIRSCEAISVDKDGKEKVYDGPAGCTTRLDSLAHYVIVEKNYSTLIDAINRIQKDDPRSLWKKELSTLLRQSNGYIWHPGSYILSARNPLLSSIRTGNLSLVRYLIKKGAQVNVNDTLWSPLHEAARYGHLDIVHYLLKKGARVLHLGPCGTTPLYEAVRALKVDVVTTLLEAKAYPHEDTSYFGGVTLKSVAHTMRSSAPSIIAVLQHYGLKLEQDMFQIAQKKSRS